MSLRFESVAYRYAGSSVRALSAVSLAVEPGQVVGVVGPNGAGKTTLCLCAVGVAPKTIGGELDGRVVIDELVSTERSMHELAQHVGILFQESQTQISNAAPTVWEEVAFGPRNLSLPLEEVVQRTWAAIDTLRLHDIVRRDPGRLSGGQAQLVALASVLALGARYLVLDEPTAQLDPEGKQLVGDALAALAAGGTGLLITEHDTDLLARLCTRVVALDEGSIALAGGASEVLTDPRLEELGVEPPAPVRLLRLLDRAGVDIELPA